MCYLISAQFQGRRHDQASLRFLPLRYDALLSRGDRRLSAFIIKADELGSWRKAAKELGLDAEGEATRLIPLEDELPWGFITGTPLELLKREYRSAFDL